MSEVDVHHLETTVTLPFPDRDRARSALRGSLSLAAADHGVHPDWMTLVVLELSGDQDELGRTCWRWSAAVGAHPAV